MDRVTQRDSGMCAAYTCIQATQSLNILSRNNPDSISERNRTQSRSPIQQRRQDSFRWRVGHEDSKSSRGFEDSRKIEDSRRRSRSPRRERAPGTCSCTTFWRHSSSGPTSLSFTDRSSLVQPTTITSRDRANHETMRERRQETLGVVCQRIPERETA